MSAAKQGKGSGKGSGGKGKAGGKALPSFLTGGKSKVRSGGKKKK